MNNKIKHLRVVGSGKYTFVSVETDAFPKWAFPNIYKTNSFKLREMEEKKCKLGFVSNWTRIWRLAQANHWHGLMRYCNAKPTELQTIVPFLTKCIFSYFSSNIVGSFATEDASVEWIVEVTLAASSSSSFDSLSLTSLPSLLWSFSFLVVLWRASAFKNAKHVRGKWFQFNSYKAHRR